MHDITARMEVMKFIGQVIGINTGMMLFLPFERPDDLDILEHWMVDNDKEYTITYMAAQKKFLAVVDMEDTHYPCLVVHEHKGIALTTAFCIAYGDPGCGFKRSLSIDYTILGDFEHVSKMDSHRQPGQ